MPADGLPTIQNKKQRTTPIGLAVLMLFSAMAPVAMAAASISVYSDSTALDASEGSPANYTVTVDNDGSEYLTVTITLTQGSTCDGYASSSDYTTIPLGAGSSTTLTLSVSVNSTATGDCDTTLMAVGSDSSGSTVQSDLVVTTTGNPTWPSGHTRFVYIRTVDSGANSQTPYTLEFSAPPMSDNSPYDMAQFCHISNGDDDDVWEAFVPTDFNSITSWSVKNVNGISLGQYVSYNLTDAEGGAMSFPMVTFEQNTSASGHVASTLSDSESYPCHSPGDDGDGSDPPDGGGPAEMGIVTYENSSGVMTHCSYDWTLSDACPMDLSTFEEGSVQITVGAWNLSNLSASLEVLSWVDNMSTNNFPLSFSDTHSIEVILPFWTDEYSCSARIEAVLQTGDGGHLNWNKSWNDLCEGSPAQAGISSVHLAEDWGASVWNLTGDETDSVNASDHPYENNWMFSTVVNSTNQGTVNLTYVVKKDGLISSQGHEERYSSVGEVSQFYTAPFTVSPYDCNVTLDLDLLDAGGNTLDSESHTLDAPCEAQPQTEVVEVSLSSDYNWSTWAVSDGDPIGASHSPDSPDYFLQIAINNTTDDWDEDWPELLNLSYTLTIDGFVAMQGYDSQYVYSDDNWDLADMALWTSHFVVSPYDCSVVFDADLLDDDGNLLDEVTLALDAPCEASPVTEIVDLEILNESYWDWEEISDGDPIDANNGYRFSLFVDNASDEWDDDWTEWFELCYEVIIDGEMELDACLISWVYDDISDDWDMSWETDSFWVSPYDCNVTFDADLLDDDGILVDDFTLSLNAPCEDIPVTEIVDLQILDEGDWSWVDVSDGDSINSTDFGYRFSLGVANASGDWTEDWTEWFDLCYEVLIDGDSEFAGEVCETRSPSDDISWETSSSFWVSPYDCLVVFNATLRDDEDNHVDDVLISLNAPCEDTPATEIVYLQVLDQENWTWEEVSDGDSINSTDFGYMFSVYIDNATNYWDDGWTDWFDLCYEILVDNVSVFGLEMCETQNAIDDPADGWDMYWETHTFWLGTYDCLVQFNVTLWDEDDNLVDDVLISLDAPCEDPPVTEIVDIQILDEQHWVWEEVSEGDLINVSDAGYQFSVYIDNSSGEGYDDWTDWFDLCYEILVDNVSLFGLETCETQWVYEDSADDWDMSWETNSFWFDQHACEITFNAWLNTDNGDEVDNTTISLDAPCVEPTALAITEVELGYFGIDEFSVAGNNATLGISDYWVDVTLSSPEYPFDTHMNVVVSFDGFEVYNHTQYSSSIAGADEYLFLMPGTFFVDLTVCQIQIDSFLKSWNGSIIVWASNSAVGPCDTDMDNDGVGDSDDAFPFDPLEYADSDGDGVGDNSDAFPFDANETQDSDADGIGNNADTDDDGDGIDDDQDDSDGDGITDNLDAFPFDANESIDSDGDGVGDNSDAFPNDANESTDSDGDGIGDNSDDDVDGDGTPNDFDDFPLSSSNVEDSDLDGVKDGDDAFPDDPNEYIDTDGDGMGNNADPDDDNDGTLDILDALPLDPTETSDTDKDGFGDNSDAFPNDPREHSDSDGDGVGDNTDKFPSDPYEQYDFDNDGVGDNSDAFPNDPNEYSDSDGDGYGNNNDAFPYDPSEWRDSNGDGVGDNEQSGSSGGQQSDSDEEGGSTTSLPGFSPVAAAVSLTLAAMAISRWGREE